MSDKPLTQKDIEDQNKVQPKVEETKVEPAQAQPKVEQAKPEQKVEPKTTGYPPAKK